jgi:hypothetical protein
MPTIDYPDELKKSFWDKKKGALDSATPVQDQLKTLQKKHEAVEWTKLEPGWAKGLAKAELQKTFDVLDKLYRTKAAPLRLEANSLVSAADKAAKAKDASKELKTAATTITKAAEAYAKAIAAGLDALEAEHKAASKNLPDDAEGDEDDEGEASSTLVDPKRLFKQLTLCKADVARQVNFAFLDDGKQAPVLVLHPRLSGRSLLAKLVKDIGIKTGAFGMISLDNTDLKLVVEKKVSGLVKRIRIPIKACGFKLGKVALLDEQGQSLDEDLGDEAELEAAETQSTETTAPASENKVTQDQALQVWAKVRETAMASLKQAAKDIAALKDPESTKAIIELNAVIKNITAEPRSKAQVADLIRYIDKDDVVLDVSEFASDIRTPLLKALTVLAKVAT